jgi:hypothetical protein
MAQTSARTTGRPSLTPSRHTRTLADSGKHRAVSNSRRRRAGNSSGISKAALFTGIGALGSFILAVLLAVVGASGGYSSLRNMIPIIGIFSLIALLGGLAAIVLGIITVSQSSKNPAMNKVHGILGICFGAIPIILWLFGMANGSRMRF